MLKWLIIGIALIPVAIVLIILGAFYLDQSIIALGDSHSVIACDVSSSSGCATVFDPQAREQSALVMIIESALVLAAGIGCLVVGVFFIVRRRLPSGQ